ncbi:zinc finger domain-containing protein [Streptomyces durhamensis]|uniref:zinc finger domain-containing protein n=1 Tax=Streptomyces durhamensis TaxID=68194 RepID=UPI00068AE469|nr:hypothetical protein [Streptomyces durhamensis]
MRRLLIRVNMTASPDRTEAEDTIVERATDYFAGLDSLTQEAVEAEAATEREAAEAASRLRTILSGLRRHDAYSHDLHSQVADLIRTAALAGDRVTAGQAQDVAIWKRRAADGAQLPWTPLHKQVARRYWIQRSCPRCHAGQGKPCVLAEGTDAGKVRDFPHDERVQPIVDERKAQQKANPKVVPRPWRVYEVTRPDCGQGPDSRCKSPGGPHRARVERAQEYTRLRNPRPR